MVDPISIPIIASATTAVNNYLNISSRLHDVLKTPSTGANAVRKLSLDHTILPKDYLRVHEQDTLVKVPLIDRFFKSYNRYSEGFTQVVFAGPSVGKTTACFAFMKMMAPEAKCQALMITGASKGEPYLTQMAEALSVSEESVLVDLVAGMTTVAPSPASVLILDEVNEAGIDDCNIRMVEVLMRLIFTQRSRINLFIVTQNETVADMLCRLNGWQKIAPMDGLTIPSISDVLANDHSATISSMDTKTVWNKSAVDWNSEQLSKFLTSRATFKDYKFEMNEDKKTVKWVEDGWTPTMVIQKAQMIMDDDVEVVKKEEGRLV